MRTRAAVAWKAATPITIEMVDLAGPREGEVLMEVKATGICHTDWYTLSGAEYNSGAPSIRFVDATTTDSTLSDLYLDVVVIASTASRLLVDSPSDNPTIIVRAPNDATYGATSGGIYWKPSGSSTYFFRIPEFELIFLPILVVLLFGLLRRRSHRRTDNRPAN